MALVAFTVLATPELAWSQMRSPNLGRIDLGACKIDPHGMIHVALGRSVFVRPFVPSWATVELSYKNNNPAPPDPEDGLGCPNHPAPMDRMGVPFDYAAINPEAAKAVPRLGVRRLLVLGWDPGLTTPSWDNLELVSAEAVCASDSIRETLPDGLLQCRTKPKVPGFRQEDWTTAYVAPLDVYATPLGVKFTTWCGPETFTYSMFDCRVSYLLDVDIRIDYEFNPYCHGRTTQLPIGLLIDFDRELRKKISSMRVLDYNWNRTP